MDKAGEVVDGRGSYQIAKLRKALSYCKSFRNAVDVGAHVGMWTMQMAKRFDHVYSFEPVAAHRECFAKNVTEPNVTLEACALGERYGMVGIVSAPTSSGDSHVAVGNGRDDGDIQLVPLDHFALMDVDFIKLDCEGYELFALRGGEATILRDKPVIIVEQKPGKAQKFGLPETGAVTYLQSLGYRQAECLSGDYIMVPA